MIDERTFTFDETSPAVIRCITMDWLLMVPRVEANGCPFANTGVMAVFPLICIELQNVLLKLEDNINVAKYVRLISVGTFVKFTVKLEEGGVVI